MHYYLKWGTILHFHTSPPPPGCGRSRHATHERLGQTDRADSVNIFSFKYSFFVVLEKKGTSATKYTIQNKYLKKREFMEWVTWLKPFFFSSIFLFVTRKSIKTTHLYVL